MALSDLNIASLLEQRKTSFNSCYWTQHIADEAHYNLIRETKSPFDWRLLYDSWLWRHVLQNAWQPTSDTRALELLPGTSLTIPVALQSAHYNGVLHRLDEELPTPLPETLHFAEHRIVGRLSDLLLNPVIYDLIVGNHIIDDLLFNLHHPNLEERKRIYLDAHLSKASWQSIATSGCLVHYHESLVQLFLEIVRSMKCPSTLILRHYPSTFALASNDLVRIKVEMQTYFSIAEALSACRQCRTWFCDVSWKGVAPGSMYPRSIFVLQKGKGEAQDFQAHNRG